MRPDGRAGLIGRNKTKGQRLRDQADQMDQIVI